MDASDPERDIAYRRIHGLEARMPGSGHRGEDPRCCAWLIRLCRCFSGDSDDSQEASPRSRALENHLYQYEAPAVPSSSGVIAQQQRSATAYEDEADAGPLLPKTAESSAPLPRPGHSRNNSSASTAAAAAVAAAAAGSCTAAGGNGGEALPQSKRPSSHFDGPTSTSSSAAAVQAALVASGLTVATAAAAAAGGLPPEGGRQGHHRSGSYGEPSTPWKSKQGDSGANAPPACAEASAVVSTVAAGAVAVAATGPDAAALACLPVPSTAAGRPGAVFGPVQDEDDDFCPTCLDPYTEENPKIFTECGHHFHMPCIYAWLERKDTCPMCESPMQAPGI